MLIILLILIFIRPFISSLAFPYINSVFSGLFLIFLIIWLVYKGTPIKQIQSLKHPLALFCLALIISVSFSIDKTNSLKEIYKYISGILLFFIATSLTYKDKVRFVHSIVLAGLIISLLSIYQYFFGFQHTLEYMTKEKNASSFALDYIQRRRIFFPFVTPNLLAGYLIMIMPLALINKNVSWFIIPLSFALLLTKSLGALLSIFVALVIYFYLSGKLGKKKGFIFLGLLIIIGLIFITRSSTQKQHLQPIFSTLMRLNYWKDTLRIIKTRPFTGAGIGNFNLPLSRYAHNSYLQIWAEMGILGIISILWLIIAAFKSAFNNIKNSQDNKVIVCLLTTNVAFLFHNLIDFSFFLPEISLIWWVALGLSKENS